MSVITMAKTEQVTSRAEIHGWPMSERLSVQSSPNGKSITVSIGEKSVTVSARELFGVVLAFYKDT